MQGMAHGKVGDVVFSRVNGEQVARVYNRNPRDARTHKQLYQRAIMATCMQAYSAGKAIFDHSWERKRVGQDCQSEFMRRNLKALRTQLAYEINEDVFANDCKAHCIWPGAKVPVANEYIISDGSYPQDVIQETIYLGEMQYLLPVPNDGESVAQYASRIGLVPDDFFTFVVFLEGSTELYKETPEEENPENIGYDCHFGYCRLHVKSNITQIATAVEDWKDIFDIDASENVRLTWFDEYGLEGPVDLKSLDPERRGVGAIGLIRSHKNSKLRSKSTMYCPSWGTLPTNVFGLNRMSILETWIAGTPSLGDSDYILEGGGGSQPTPTPVPLHYLTTDTVENTDQESEEFGRRYIYGTLTDGREGFAYAQRGSLVFYWGTAQSGAQSSVYSTDFDDFDVLSYVESKGIDLINLGEFDSWQSANLAVYPLMTYGIEEGLFARNYNNNDVLLVDGDGRKFQIYETNNRRIWSLHKSNGVFQLKPSSGQPVSWGLVTWYVGLVSGDNDVTINGVTYNFHLNGSPVTDTEVTITPNISDYSE